MENRAWPQEMPELPEVVSLPGRWVDAASLRAGDLLHLVNGHRVPVDSVTSLPCAEKVFNLEVAEIHTYAVGRIGVLVHNNEGICPGSGGAANKGPYRGGSHADMSGPGTRGDGLDSHHMPHQNANPNVNPKNGPAIQMDPWDHYATSSNGRHGAEAARYRAEIAKMIRDGRVRDAMAREILDVRRAANQASNNPAKYNEAIKEMLEYAKRTGQLPSRN